MLNSLFFAFHKEMMPLTITDPEAVGKILELLPEIKERYGDNADYALTFDLAPEGETAIKLDSSRGVILGDLDEVKMTMSILASNNRVSNQVACEFQFNFELPLYLQLQNMKLDLHMHEVTVDNFKLTKDNAGMYGRNYQQLFTKLFNAQLQALNGQFAAGVDLTQFDISLQLLAGYFTNTNISPFVQDGFIYGGFDFVFDNSAKWSDEDIQYHANHDSLRNAVLGLFGKQ